MKKVIAVVLVALSASISHAQQAISFKSPPDAFRVNSTATGSVTKSGPFLQVRLDQYTIWSGKAYTDPSDVRSYKVGLASNNTNGVWSVLRWSAAISAPMRMGPGETKQMPTSTLLIPIDSLQTLEGTWLVLQVTLRSDGSEGTTYAHSEKLKLQ